MAPYLVIKGITLSYQSPDKSVYHVFVSLLMRHIIHLNPPGQRGAFELVRTATKVPFHNILTRYNASYYNIQSLSFYPETIMHPRMRPNSILLKGELLTPHEQTLTDHLIIYVHGGAYHFLAPHAFRFLTLSLIHI